MASDLTTRYLGMELSSPVIVGACPLTIQPKLVRQLIDAGAGAIVLPSILQEQIDYAQMKAHDPLEAKDSSGYQPQQDKYNGGTENYLATIRQLKSNHQIPIFASMNGSVAGDWIDYAREIEASGADGLELNWQPVVSSPGESAEHLEECLCELVRRVRAVVGIPIAVKLNQRFTNLASIAHKIKSAGASGLILFTHMPHWDVSIDRMHWTIRWELSPIDSLGGILEGIVRTRAGGLNMSIAASGGIRCSDDAIKSMIAGADAVMVTSEIYREGPGAIRKIVDGIDWYLQTSRYDTLLEFQQARPTIELGPQGAMRFEYVDPLTLLGHSIDPTPVPEQEAGDAYGNRR